jgi:hypothetical protein
VRLVTALGRALHAGRPTTIIEVIREFPDIAEAAKYLTGAPKGSKAYLAQRRNLERYKQGTRKPKPTTLRKLRRKVERRRVNLRSRGAQVEISGVVTVSKDTRRRTIRGRLAGDSMDQLWDTWEQDREEAVELFQELYGADNMGGQYPSWENVDFLRITELGQT